MGGATTRDGRSRSIFLIKRIAIATALTLVAAVAAVAFISLCFETESRLVLRDGKGVELAELVLPGGRFDHVFIHSFHLTPVEERYRLEPALPFGIKWPFGEGGPKIFGLLFGARLRLWELRYESSGVGMPEDAELGYRLEKGKFILAMERRFDRIPFMVSIVPGHGIVTGGVFHPFTTWVPMEGRIAIEGRYVLVRRTRRRA